MSGIVAFSIFTCMESETSHPTPDPATITGPDPSIGGTEERRADAPAVSKIRSNADNDEELRDLFFGC